jgi:hypothetical protein
MNNRQRLLCALSHRQPDKTPWHITFTQTAHQKTADYYHDADFECVI